MNDTKEKEQKGTSLEKNYHQGKQPIDDSEARRELRKILGLPEDFEPNPNAVEELAGCLDEFFPEGTKVDVIKLVREIRRI